MRKANLLLLVCTLAAAVLRVLGQDQPKKDSSRVDTLYKDSSHVVENLLLQQQTEYPEYPPAPVIGEESNPAI